MALQIEHGVDFEEVAPIAEQPEDSPPSPAASVPLRSSAGSSLVPYMREMARRECLGPEDEIRLGRELEARLLRQWIEVLAYAPMTEYLLRFVEERLGRSLPEFRPVRKAAGAVKTTRTKLAQQKLQRAAGKAALQLQIVDPDREHLQAVMDEVVYLSTSPEAMRARRLFCSSSSRSYQRYLQRIRQAERGTGEVRNVFIEANLRLVVSIARHFMGHGLPLSDLIQEGNLGLMKAVDRFDYRRGCRFSTYASWWIRHNIRRALQDKARTIRVPVHVFDASQRVSRAQRELAGVLGRMPTADEVCKATGYSPEKLEVIGLQVPRHTVSLDEPIDHDEGRTLLEIFRDPENEAPSAIDQLARRTTTEQVLRLVEELPAREIDILNKRFALDGERAWTLQEIADLYHLSRERVRQIEEKALATLRRKVSEAA